jgi:excisionase family DNA binding protein
MMIDSNLESLYHEYMEVAQNPVAAAILTVGHVLQNQIESEAEIINDSGALNVKEAARQLNISSKKVYELCLIGRLKCFRAGRSIRITSEELRRFQNEV